VALSGTWRLRAVFAAAQYLALDSKTRARQSRSSHLPGPRQARRALLAGRLPNENARQTPPYPGEGRRAWASDPETAGWLSGEGTRARARSRRIAMTEPTRAREVECLHCGSSSMPSCSPTRSSECLARIVLAGGHSSWRASAGAKLTAEGRGVPFNLRVAYRSAPSHECEPIGHEHHHARVSMIRSCSFCGSVTRPRRSTLSIRSRPPASRRGTSSS
jgi:hypothetical protein